MKKRFLAFICLLLVGAMLLCACDLAIEEETKPNFATEKKTEKETETQRKSETNKKPTETQPKKESTINGKKPSEIVEKIFHDYALSNAFDLAVF